MKIAVITTTRAEYGLLRKLIKCISLDKDCELSLVVSGTHLLEEYGYTVRYIEEDGFFINHRIKIDIVNNNPIDISINMSNYLIEFSKLFSREKFDFIVVLGDRYELLPICSAAMVEKIPIAHISGGEVTSGAIDDCIRHCVTKMSYLHFPACDDYRKRIIQLGENPTRVFNVGDPGVENIYDSSFPNKDNLLKKLGVDFEDYFVVLYHPTTLDSDSPENQINKILDALSIMNKYNYIFIRSNADYGGTAINNIIEKYVEKNNNCVFFSSLKIDEFLALQKYSMGLIGNSSSGIVETPCFKIPTLNIGNRQKGRLYAESIISVTNDVQSIVEGIRKCISKEFLANLANTINPYGRGDTSNLILQIIKESYNNGVDLEKKFYDLEVKK